MMTAETAFELSRLRLELVQERAALMAMLGELPKPQSLFPFRRRVMPLAATVEVRHAVSDKERIRRRLVELSATQGKAS